MQVSRLASLALLTAAVAAQGVVISPVGAATVEGASANIFPWNSAVVRRYLQIHSDLGATPLLITMLSFRGSANTTNNLGTRIHDLELYMGDGVSALQPSYIIDNNYVSPKTLVIPRSFITFGPQGQGVTPGPNPFTGLMDLALPAPFIYTGVNSLNWEVTYYGQTTGAAGTVAATDAEVGIFTTGVSTITGAGCIATGQAVAMTHTFTASDVAGTLLLNATVTAGPASALTFLAIGFTNPNLVFPGLCATVYTDAIVSQVMGVTSATGTITTTNPAAATIIVPNSIAGVTITSQAFALDLARVDPIPFCASNGRSVVVPAPNLTRINLATRIFNNVGGTTATEAVFFGTSTAGYALVTQFSHL